MSPPTIRPLNEEFTNWDELLVLILSSFAYMNDRIDPPSSALTLSVEALKSKAKMEIGYVIFDQTEIAGCVFCRPEADCVYVGKLAVLPGKQGKGLGRVLLEIAEDVASRLGKPALRLETRIELAENHAVFAACGFEKTAENAHPGFTRTTSIEMRKRLG